MKKIVFTIIVSAIFLLPVKVFAAETFLQEIEDLTQQYSNEDVDFINNDLSETADYLIEILKKNLTKPLKITFKLAAVILFYSIVQIMYADGVKANMIYETVCTLIVFINLLNPLKELLILISDNLYSVKNFMVSFLPIFAGISMASGEVFSSSVYTGFLLTSMVFVSNICLNQILPSVKIYFALIISNALSPYIRLKSLSDFYIKSIKSLMQISVSFICFILTIQTTITQGKDTLAVKAGKLLSGGAIPVIGSTLQDAVASVYASMESIKGFAGATGLATVVGIFLPSLITLLIYWCLTNRLYIFSDIFDAVQIKRCIKGYMEIVGLMISIVVLYTVMLIFSITIFIALTNGA